MFEVVQVNVHHALPLLGGREEHAGLERWRGVLSGLWGHEVLIHQVMEDLVHGVVLGTFPRHVGALELILSSGRHVPAVWLQGAVVVVFGTGPKQLQGVRDISLHDFLTGRPIVQDGDVVSQRPAGATGSGCGPLAEVTKLGVSPDLRRQRRRRTGV